MRQLVFAVCLFLAACSEGPPAWAPAPETWQDLTIRMETRPVQVRHGMNEFLLIASHQQRGFINNLLVQVRTESSGPGWKQAIPDGALGVYRRALPVNDVAGEHLYVRLTRNGQHGEMTFPLSPTSGD
ncbi:hypothetical protein [Mariprofundus ferrooxydans]|uniref:hypothetical protein n=1 Tax=Mariprofundus ferrooxydans TaxID=314344 RepID=UPI00036FA776|nr:hypothetical protein [Mariprofundus ferrooxydans]